MRRPRSRPTLLFWPILAVLIGYVAWPQLEVFRQSLTQGGAISLANYRRFFDLDHPVNLVALWNSVWVSVASVFFAGLIGVPLALLVTRVAFPLRGVVASLAVLPLLLPPIVGVLAFKQFLFGEYGLFPKALRHLFGVEWHLDGFAGVIALHAYAFFPFFYLFVAAGQKRLDPALPEAAFSLGASRLRTLLTITLPLLMPAIAGAAVLVLLNAFGSFSAPLFFAPTEEILTLRIYNLRASDPEMVTVISTLLALTALALLIPMRRLEARADVISAAKGQVSPASLPDRAWVRVLFATGSVLVVTLLLLPHLSILLLSFVDETTASASVIPRAFTLDHYRHVFAEDAFTTPIRNSLQMALLAAVANVAVGVGAAVLILNRRTPARWLVELLAFLPLALPATVIAFNMLAAFSVRTPMGLGQVLAGTWLLLPLAYFVRNLPIVVRSTMSSLATLDPNLLDAAHSLGASRFTAFRRVVLPMVMPGVLSGTLLAFLAGLSEFVASILIYIPENLPIAVEIFNRRYNRSLGEPAALSVLLLLSQAIVVVIVNRYLKVERSSAR